MSSTKTIKPVAFNSKNPKEAAMLKFVKRRNFSGYIKKLIGEDMERRGVWPTTQQEATTETAALPVVSLEPVEPPKPQKPNMEAETPRERFERLRQQQKNGQPRPTGVFIPKSNNHIDR